MSRRLETVHLAVASGSAAAVITTPAAQKLEVVGLSGETDGSADTFFALFIVGGAATRWRNQLKVPATEFWGYQPFTGLVMLAGWSLGVFCFSSGSPTGTAVTVDYIRVNPA